MKKDEAVIGRLRLDYALETRPELLDRLLEDPREVHEADARTFSSPPGTHVLARIPSVFGSGRDAEMTYYELRRAAPRCLPLGRSPWPSRLRPRPSDG